MSVPRAIVTALRLSAMQTDQVVQTQSRTCKTTGERIGDVSCVFLHKQCKVPRCETARALWVQITQCSDELARRLEDQTHVDTMTVESGEHCGHSNELLNRLWNVEVFQVFDKELVPQHHVVRRGETRLMCLRSNGWPLAVHREPATVVVRALQ